MDREEKNSPSMSLFLSVNTYKLWGTPTDGAERNALRPVLVPRDQVIGEGIVLGSI